MSAAAGSGQSANQARRDMVHRGERADTIATMSGWAQAGVSAALWAAYAVPVRVRARTLRAAGAARAAWRLGCFGARRSSCSPSPSARSSTRAADERLSGAHGRARDDRRPGAAAARARDDRSAARTCAARARGRGDRAASAIRAALALWAASLYLWHLRVAYEAAVRHDVIHVLEHACFFAFGVNLWLALLGPLPKPAWFGNGARLAYVVVVNLVGAGLAYTLAWAIAAVPDLRGHGGGQRVATRAPPAA